MNRGDSLPVGKRAAAFLDDRLHGCRVPDVHDGIDHQLGAAGRDKQVAVAVAPGARDRRGRLKTFKNSGGATLGETVDLRSQKNGVRQPRLLRYAAAARRLVATK